MIKEFGACRQFVPHFGVNPCFGNRLVAQSFRDRVPFQYVVEDERVCGSCLSDSSFHEETGDEQGRGDNQGPYFELCVDGQPDWKYPVPVRGGAPLNVT